MKKTQTLLLAVSFSIIAASCYHRGRHVTIQSNNNGYITRVDYSGKIAFDDNETSISHMSPHSYFKFRKGNETLEARCDNRGRITYVLSDGNESNTLTDEGKNLLAEAVKTIEKAQGKKR